MDFYPKLGRSTSEASSETSGEEQAKGEVLVVKEGSCCFENFEKKKEEMTPDYTLPILGLLGLMVSLYIVYVERNLAASATYKPACDSETLRVSCSKVLGSEAGHLLSFLNIVPTHSELDISNGILGCVFYVFVFIVPNLNILPLKVKVWSTFAASIFSSAVSLFLGYIMLKDLQEICIICSFLQLVNLFILIYSFRWYKAFSKRSVNINNKKKSKSL